MRRTFSRVSIMSSSRVAGVSCAGLALPDCVEYTRVETVSGVGLVSTESPTSEVVITSVESAPAAATAFVTVSGSSSAAGTGLPASVRRSATRSDVLRITG